MSGSSKAKLHLKDIPYDQGNTAKVQESTDHLSPTYCLRHLQEPYALAHVEKLQKLRPVLDALAVRCQMSWGNLKQESHKGLGWESAPKIDFSKPWPFPGRPWMIFRIGNNEGRMVGYRDGRTFVIVWLDCDFTLYKH